MSESTVPTSSWRRKAWLPALLGAAPHVAVIVYAIAPSDVAWSTIGEPDLYGFPFSLFGGAELLIVPLSLFVAGGLAVVRQTRPWALSLLFGCFAGATAVLMVLVWVANAWGTTWDRAPGP